MSRTQYSKKIEFSRQKMWISQFEQKILRQKDSLSWASNHQVIVFLQLFCSKHCQQKNHPVKICWEFWIAWNIGSVNYSKIRFLIIIYFVQVGQRKMSWRGHGGHKVWASWQLAAPGVPCVSTIWAGPNRLRSVQLHTLKPYKTKYQILNFKVQRI